MTLDHIPDSRAAAVLRRLHRDADRQMPRMFWQHLPRLAAMLTSRTRPFDDRNSLDKDLYLSLDARQAAFVYSLVCASKSRCIVEFGTSVGVSTIWLALAARANWGRVITTEIDPDKAAKAQANLEEAGLADVVDLRLGDASETLRELDEPVDFFLSDGAPDKALRILRLVQPVLVPGATVVTKHVSTFSADYRACMDWLRHPDNGFVSTTVPLRSSIEVSVYNGTTAH